MRQIIIVSNTFQLNNTMNLNYIYWLNTPAGVIKSNPSFISLAPGTTVAEMTALQSGSVTEQSLSATIPLAWSPITIGQYLVERYLQQSLYFSSVGSIKNYTNTYYDGTVWQNVPV